MHWFILLYMIVSHRGAATAAACKVKVQPGAYVLELRQNKGLRTLSLHHSSIHSFVFRPSPSADTQPERE